MDLYLMIAILIANAITIGIVYQFVKKLQNKQKLIFIAISVAIMYILISITYWISGFGIDEKIHEETKSFITYLFVPVNTILFIPYFASQYMKLRTKQIKPEKFFKKLITLCILLVVVLVIEYFYFRNVQKNINMISENVEQSNTITNEIEDENNLFNEETNSLEENITNSVSINEID